MKMAALEKTAPSFFKLDNKSDTLESNMSTKLKKPTWNNSSSKNVPWNCGWKGKNIFFLDATASLQIVHVIN